MLTRRSRKEVGATSPDIEPPTPARRRSKSRTKSVDKKKIRTRSKSANKTIPKVVIERLNLSEKNKKELKKKPVELDSKLRKSPTPVNRSSPLGDKSNNIKVSSANSSKLDYDDASDSEPLVENDTKAAPVLPVEFGGSFGNIILALLLPIVVIVAKIALKAKGILIPFPRGYLRFANYYDQDVFLWTTAIVIFQLLISLVPLAKKSKGLKNDDSNPIYYRFSGPVNLILILGALTVDALNYYKLPLNFIQEIAIKKSVPHIVASILSAFIISMVLRIKSKYASVHNKQRTSVLSVIQTFFVGTTTNPTLGPINIKLALYRYSLLLTILFNYVIIIDSLKNPINIHLYFVAGLQILFALDKLIFEFNLLSSFYLQKEKDGYWTLIQPFLQPVINVLPIQVLLANNLPVNYIILSISSIIFLVGLVFQRYSELTKYQYENKSNYAGGRKVDYGLWSYIKYPNYLGSIIIHLAVILPAFVPCLDILQASWPVILYPLYYIVTLSHRCVRVSTYYRLQYGYVWDLNKVKWNLIPKIF